MNTELFHAILALDSYNRGQGSFLQLEGTQLGTTSILNNMSFTSEADRTAWENSSFSANVYEFNDTGERVIAFRGTDDDSLLADPLNGWLGALGVQVSQLQLAEQLYKQVAGVDSVFDPSANVTLTGHSLGGGLAGYVGALSGVNATLFNHMPFTAAVIARVADELITLGLTDPGELLAILLGEENGPDASPAPSLNQLTALSVDNEILEFFRDTLPDIPTGSLLFNPILDTALNLLAAQAVFKEGQINTTQPLPDFSGSVLDTFKLHTQSLLVIQKYGDTAFNNQSWQTVFPSVFQSLFDDDLAQRAVTVPNNLDFADSLRTKIAYSAITEGERPFGDTAILSLFQDANRLGSVLGLDGVNLALRQYEQALANSLTQFAGHLAENDVEQLAIRSQLVDNNIDNLGIFNVADNSSLFSVNFSEALWDLAFGNRPVPAQHDIFGRDEIVSQAIAGIGADRTTADDAFAYLFDGATTDIVDTINFELLNDGRLVTLPDQNAADDSSEDVTSLTVLGDGDDTVIGGNANDLISGGAGNDFLIGWEGSDVLIGGIGDDTIVSTIGDERDLFSGGEGTDTLRFSFKTSDDAGNDTTGLFDTDLGQERLSVTLDTVTLGNQTALQIDVSSQKSGTTFGQDLVLDFEHILLSRGGDTVDFGATLPSGDVLENLIINGNALEPLSGRDVTDVSTPQIRTDTESHANRSNFDTLDFSGLSSGIDFGTFTTSTLATGGSFLGFGRRELYEGLEFRNFEVLEATQFDDTVVIANTDTIQEVNLGDGNDTLLTSASGTIVRTGDGADRIHLSHNILVEDLSADDTITIFGLADLGGGLRNANSESPYAVGFYGELYAFNTQGQLVISHSALRNNDGSLWEAFFDNPDVDVTTPFDQRTGGIVLGELSIEVERLLDAVRFRPDFDGNESTEALLKAALDIWATAATGEDFSTGFDPLVLDLDGDGIELRAENELAPSFDLDGDGFAERTSFVLPDDGLLALDRNANGTIDDVTELFGAPNVSGFTELALLDTNSDGIIDAQDDQFADLVVWQDFNQNGVSENGEKQSLSNAGIASISLNSTLTNEVIAGSTIAATAAFTRTDGTTSTVADVIFDGSNFYSTFLGDNTVSAAAMGLPDLRGHGTLTDLRVAATLDDTGTLQQVVTDVLPTLTSIDLDTLVAQAQPILFAWTQASPGGNGVSGQSIDTHYFSEVTPDGVEVTDIVIRETDAAGNTFYGLASGHVVKDDNGLVISQPTLQEVVDFGAPEGSTARVLTANEVAFFERYADGELSVESIDSGDDQSFAAFADIVEVFDTISARLTIQLALEGPLAPFFEGITFNRETDRFEATSDQSLVPALTSIFNGAPSSENDIGAYLTSWSEILNVILANYDRGGDHLLLTKAFLFTNIIGAYENSAINAPLTTVADALGVPADEIVHGSGEIVGTAGSDLFYLDASDQAARGGFGSDVYVVGQNFGNDVIDDFEEGGTPADFDTLRFSAHNSEDVILSREGLDLAINEVNGTGTIRVLEHFHEIIPLSVSGSGNALPDRGVDEIVFANGDVFTAFDIALAVSNPTDEDQTITGTDHIDVLNGGAGDDILSGGENGDFYIYGRGFGNDTIRDQQQLLNIQSIDVVQFIDGIRADDLIFNRVEDSDTITLTFDGFDGSLTLEGQVRATYTGVFGTEFFNQIDVFTFDDGSFLSADDLRRETLLQMSTDGDDVIYGFDAIDVLDGGAGDDFLSGGNENDIYIFNVGDGNDTIFDNGTNILSGEIDRLVFGEGIESADLTFTRLNNDDLLINFANETDSVFIDGQFNFTETGPFGVRNFTLIEEFEFHDGILISWIDILNQIFAEAATSGDDTIIGFHFDDRLDGGTGNDFLSGGNGEDTYVFRRGSGNDTISDDLENILSGTDDTIEFEGINFSDLAIDIGAGAEDVVFTIRDTGETLTIVRQNFRTTLEFSPYLIENFTFADGTTRNQFDVIAELIIQDQTDGDDIVQGFYTYDVLDGGLGNDILRGSDGNDIYIFNRGYGHDLIQESRNNFFIDEFDIVQFGDGIFSSDLSFEIISGTSDLKITILDTGETLTIDNQFSVTTVGTLQDVEEFHFADGSILDANEILQNIHDQASTDGDDVIIGTQFAEVFQGGLGNDEIIGGRGNDTYIYTRGDGNDIIDDDYIFVSGAEAIDTLVLHDILVSEISVSRAGDDLILTVSERVSGSGDGGIITLRNSVDGFFHEGIDRVQFDDGTVLSQFELVSQFIALSATDGDDVIIGSDLSDVLQGGLGDDLLVGDQGNDTYIYTRGDGNDVIDDDYSRAGGAFAIDTLVLRNIDSSDVEVTRAGNDFILTIAESADGAGDGGTLTLKHSVHSFFYHGIDEIVFDDGTIWNQQDLRDFHFDAISTDGDDTIVGTNTIDVLVGGLGDDMIFGGRGNDVYVYTRGDGNDVFDETTSSSSAQGFDTLQLTNIDVSDVSVSRSGNDFILMIAESIPGAGDGGVLTLKHSLNSFFSLGIEWVTFDDGTVWTQADLRAIYFEAASTDGDDTIVGSTTNDTLIGGLGDDMLFGSRGNDVYVYARGDGNDVFDEATSSSNGSDTLQLINIDVSAVSVSRFENDFILTIAESVPGAGDGGVLALKHSLNSFFSQGIEWVTFDDGTVWTQADLREIYFDAISTDGDDTIVGSTTNDILIGGLGDDMIFGGRGNDTYIYTRGDGNDVFDEATSSNNGSDTLQLVNVNVSDVSVSRLESDFILTIAESTLGAGDGGMITLRTSVPEQSTRGVDQIIFDDGTTWSQQDLFREYLKTVSTDGDDVLIGSGADDVLSGGAGNDTIDGGNGNDDHFGGDGDDLLIGNSGADSFDGGEGVDTLDFTFTSNSYQIDLGAGIATFTSGATEVVANIENIIAGSGNNVITGNDLDNFIDGGSGNDVLSGGAGNDTIDGGNGNDDHFGGEGDDLLIGNSGADTFDGGAGIDTLDFTYTSDNYQVNLGAGTATFTSGSTEVVVNIENVIGGSGNNLITGSDVNNTIDGGAGNDTLQGDAGDDILIGGAGSDTLDGGAGFDAASYINSQASVIIDLANAVTSGGDADGDILINIEDLNGSNFADHLLGTDQENFIFGEEGNDTIEGRGGNDLLDGNGGNDTILAGDGDDRIFGGFGDDTLTGGAGADEINGGDGFDLASYFDSDAAVIVDLELGTASGGHAEGDTLISIEDVDGSFFADTILGNQDDNFIYGHEDDDTLNGRDGDDLVDGNDGDDIVLGGLGNDTLFGGIGNDTLNGGDGIDALTGGAGADTFVFDALSDSTTSARDVVTDFERDVDLIDVSALNISYGDISVAEVDGDTEISVAQTDFVFTLQGTGHNLNQEQFVF